MPDEPVIALGQPGQVAHLLQSWVRLVDAEPDRTFDDGDVREAASELVDRLWKRLER